MSVDESPPPPPLLVIDISYEARLFSSLVSLLGVVALAFCVCWLALVNNHHYHHHHHHDDDGSLTAEKNNRITEPATTHQISFLIYLPITKKQDYSNDNDDDESTIIWNLISASCTEFQNLQRSRLFQRSQTLQAVETIGNGILYEKWTNDLQELAHIMEHDLDALQALLREGHANLFATAHRALPTKNTAQQGPTPPTRLRTENETTTTHSQFVMPTFVSAQQHSYQDLYQVVAHLVRDWTAEGEAIRSNIYGWCIQKVNTYVTTTNETARILVPGAGVGRLAWELSVSSAAAATRHCSVEAVECSWTMVLVTVALLRGHVRGTLHPYSADRWSNQVSKSHRVCQVSFPDVSTLHTTATNRLSYTVADFTQLSTLTAYQQAYDVIVTSFFLDTAVNVLDYIDTVCFLLKPKTGLWINVGPLQWHQHSQVQFSVEELKQVLVTAGFVILEWSVDTDPVEYRNAQWNADSVAAQSTHYDAYCPLRFVLQMGA